MMFIPRNATLKTPTMDEVLGSGIIIPKAQVVHAHRGNEPIHDLRRIPQGILLVLGEGTAFLATGEQLMPPQMVTEHLAAYIASRGGPTGGVFRAVMNGAEDLAWPEPAIHAAFDQALQHPDTIVFPHVDLIQAESVPGSRFPRVRRPSTVLTRESAQGLRESIYITPTESELADSLIMLRFMAEKRTIRLKVLRSQVDLSGIELEVFKKYRSQFPSTVGTQRGRIAAEVMHKVATHLESKGSSLTEVDATVLSELDYFRVVPQFAKYFALAS